MSEIGKITDVDLIQTLPVALTHDESVIAFAKALAVGLQENAKLAKRAGIYYRIDELPENILDALAVDLHVDWYDYNAKLDRKRAVVASSIFVHRYMGTPAAVQRILDDYFGEGKVVEWFDYGGQHHHFRIETDNMSMVDQNLERFLTMLSKAKRASAVLDEIEVKLEKEAVIGTGIAARSSFDIVCRMDAVELPDHIWLVDNEGSFLLDEHSNILIIT